MNWRAMGVWLDLDDYPNSVKLAANRVGTVYVDPRSGSAKWIIADLRAHGFQAGIYEVPQWYGDTTPKQFASIVSNDIARLIPQAYPLPSQAQGAPVMLDLEVVSFEWQREMLGFYRQLRLTRETAYTNEPFKDGTVVPLGALISAGVHWYPQMYRGDMTPADPAAVILELVRWGYPPNMLHPFYDGAHLPGDARDGCIFTQRRLP